MFVFVCFSELKCSPELLWKLSLFLSQFTFCILACQRKTKAKFVAVPQSIMVVVLTRYAAKVPFMRWYPAKDAAGLRWLSNPRRVAASMNTTRWAGHYSVGLATPPTLTTNWVPVAEVSCTLENSELAKGFGLPDTTLEPVKLEQMTTSAKELKRRNSTPAWHAEMNFTTRWLTSAAMTRSSRMADKSAAMAESRTWLRKMKTAAAVPRLTTISQLSVVERESRKWRTSAKPGTQRVVAEMVSTLTFKPCSVRMDKSNQRQKVKASFNVFCKTMKCDPLLGKRNVSAGHWIIYGLC